MAKKRKRPEGHWRTRTPLEIGLEHKAFVADIPDEDKREWDRRGVLTIGELAYRMGTTPMGWLEAMGNFGG